MPNKMLYVAENDLPLLERAQEVSGTSLSATVVEALRRYVRGREMSEAGFQEQLVDSYRAGIMRHQRFQGVELARRRQRVGDAREELSVYRTAKGQFAVHRKRQPDDHYNDEPSTALEVYPTLEAMQEHLPEELFRAVSEAVDLPAIQDLDI